MWVINSGESDDSFCLEEEEERFRKCLAAEEDKDLAGSRVEMAQDRNCSAEKTGICAALHGCPLTPLPPAGTKHLLPCLLN